MKKLTASVLLVVLSSSFAMVKAQNGDTLRTQKIEEVVVTGALGIKKRADEFTASNKVVGSAELNQAANPNAAQALIGKVGGLQINTTNNSVDSSTRIVLRGPRSITGNNQALIVIDNVISSSAVFQQLPPEIIENVNVIKGPAGSALYGEKGSNGVIIVTTKRGAKSEKIQFNITSSVDISSVYKLPITQNRYGNGIQDATYGSQDYGGTNYVPWENTSWGPAFSSSLGGQMVASGLPNADGTFVMTPYQYNKDNIGKFFKNGVIMQNGVSMNVGGPDSYAFLSINRTENDFMVEGDKLKRNSILFKGGKKFGKLRIDGNFNLIDQRTTQTDSNLYDDLIQTPNTVNVRDFRDRGLEGHWTAYAQNPYWTIANVRDNRQSTYLNAIIGVEYAFTDHISLSYNGNLNTSASTGTSYNNGFAFETIYDNTGTGIDGLGLHDFGQTDIRSNFFQSTSRTRNYYGDLMLNFNYELSSDFGLKANLGNNIQDNYNTYNQVGGYDLQTPGFYNINNVLTPEKFYNLSNGFIRNRSFAVFANVDLSFKDYLFLNATYRYEKSSVTSDYKIPDNNRGYSYYSAGLSFIATKAFPSIKNDILNYAKLTGAYTRTGNTSNVAPYAIDQIGVFPTGYPFNSLSSYIFATSKTSRDVKPEYPETFEAGLNLGLFKDRITIEASAYHTKTADLITFGNVSNASGIARLQDNVGDMTNRGFDVDLGLIPIKTSDFEWRLGGSFTTYKTKVTDLGEGIDEVNLLSYSSPAVGIFAIKGQESQMIKGTKYQRDPNGNIIVGANGVPLTTSTFEVLGKVNPDYIIGMTTSIRYKGFTLSGVADYRTGNSFVSITKRLLGFTGGLEKTAEFDRSQGYIVPGSVQNTGTAANPIYTPNTTPVLGLNNYTGVTNYFTGAYLSTGEEFVVDGTALKVREIALSYKIPSSVLSNTFINSMTLGVYARNPFVIYAKDNRNYADPETSSTTGNAAGVALTGQYPTARNFGFNINVTF
ncbi:MULTISPECIES: SusC/RagA family TonB-linked outer membrane protein [Chryseobacterium]|uniref:SusC/RagA family TonB-linked outer membrane protein n=2 Tax=Pseudomonadati TaxID=3379134 RepID=A0A3D9BEA9_9FLAO|nr:MULTISPECIES: SusC/RagA family TonB-linked outer membrane protein [Chryseobacterium]REC51859.1 SusC/RagA family TonB-linked outer membrane protein [Candidatus Chryseobacterium massiliae]